MFMFARKPRAILSRLQIPSRSIYLLLLACLLLFTATAVAQDDDAGDPDVPEPIILSEKVLPYGVQTTTRIYTSKDAFIASSQPGTNYGSWTSMRMGYETPTLLAVRPLMQFNTSTIPANANVNSAILNIYQSNSIPSNGAPMGYKAQYMTQSWNESTVTWNNANYLGGATIGIGENTNTLGWKTVDISDLIRSWVSGSEPNHGMLIVGNESPPPNNSSRWFYTKEFSGGSFRPFVDVNYTSCTDTTKPFASINVLPQWSKGSFTVSWSGTDSGGSGIAYYNIQYNQNGGSWHTWLSHVTSTSATFDGSNGQTYGFRAQAVDNCGNVQDWTGTQAWTIVDSLPPQAYVNLLPEYTLTNSFPVTWSGSDNAGGSGIVSFDIDVQVDNGPWTAWLRGVTSNSATFTNAQDRETYGFRARATDRAGNVQPWPASAQAETLVVLEPYAQMEPIIPSITGAENVTLHWEGATAPGTQITEYRIRYRFNNSAWTLWQSFDGLTTSAVFTFTEAIDTSTDGRYDFEVTATNSLGQSEEPTGVPEAFVLVDRFPPFIGPTNYLPYFSMQ